jgi:hypothetical protein
MSNKHVILEKLDAFIRKYYKNELLKGVIWVVGGIISAFLIVSSLEYFGNFSQTVRTILFFSFLGLSGLILTKYVAIPMAHLYKMGKTINYSDASKIIGKHFPDIQDRLLNTIQLDLNNTAQNKLLEAAILQRTKQLQPVPFQKAVDFKSNMKYLKYAIAPVLAFIVIMLVSPGFTNSTKRVVNYNVYFEKEAPFSFNLLNSNLEILQNEDFEINVETKGSVKPSEVWVDISGNLFKMKNEKGTRFTYLLKNVNSSKLFHFTSNESKSKDFKLSIIPKASLLSLSAIVDYPSHTGLKDEVLDNPGDITLPEGTVVSWSFFTRNTSQLTLRYQNILVKAKKAANGFKHIRRFMQSEEVTITPKNQGSSATDSISYRIQVIKDEFPTIDVEEQNDSSVSKKKYLIGQLGDDYGINKLSFNYRVIKKNEKPSPVISVDIPTNKSTTDRFFHFWDLNEIELDPSDKVEYFFEVWDNDGVNGSKSTKSGIQIVEIPSIDEINSKTEKTNKQIKSEISESKSDIKKMNEELEEIQRKLTEKKSLSWEEKQKIKEILDQHKELEKEMESLIDKNKQKNEEESQFKELDEEILEKQKQLEELFEKVVDEEMKELMRKIEELMEKNNKEDLNESLEEMKMKDQDVAKQLDRMMEQLKRLEVEKEMNDHIEKLDKLAKKQKKLSEETKKSDKSKNEDLKKKQNELNKEFDDLKKDLKKTEKKNGDLKSPMKLDTKKQQQKEISEDQKQSSESLQKKKNSKASQKQKDASDKMKKMSDELNQMMSKAQAQQDVEDYNTLREILENLILVSKDQERVMNEFKITRGYSPKYVDLGQQQRKIRDDTKIIEDSLFALSKRSLQVKHFINEELTKVNSNIGKSIANIGERQTSRVVSHQQLTMTSMNNLALMLSESLKQMQEQMKKKSSSSCNKPGQKNPNPNSMKSLKQMQKQLEKQLKSMQEGMKKGKKPGAKQFGEAASQQAAIRKKLRDIQRRLDKEGKGKKLGNMKQTQQMMDDLERDLYNKRLTPTQIKKQQEIMIRLLEHDKAQQEQEQEQKRKSTEGRDIDRKLPPSIEKYLKEKQKEQELLETLPPDLSPYYKKRVRNYFKSLGQ